MVPNNAQIFHRTRRLWVEMTKEGSVLSWEQLAEQASKAMPELAVAARALQDENLLKRVQEPLEQNRAKPADKITLRIGEVTPVESDRWHDW